MSVRFGNAELKLLYPFIFLYIPAGLLIAGTDVLFLIWNMFVLTLRDWKRIAFLILIALQCTLGYVRVTLPFIYLLCPRFLSTFPFGL